MFLLTAPLLLIVTEAAHLRAGGVREHLVGSAGAVVARSNQSQAISAKGTWYATEYASDESCDAACGRKGMSCDLLRADLESKKDLKNAAKTAGLECDGIKTGDYPEAPYLVLQNSADTKGKCYRPADPNTMDCSLTSLAGTRRLCWCLSGPAPAPAPPPTAYVPIWQKSWVWPVVPSDEWKFEVCTCYAAKDKQGGDALPSTLIHLDQDDGGYDGECATYCRTSSGGPFHAADIHMLSAWSTRRPAVIVLHGSGGSKDETWTVYMTEKFRDAGFVVMTIQFTSGTCDVDVGNAVEFLKTHADSYGVIPDSIALYGWSRGAQCVLRAGYKNAHLPNQNVKAVVDMSGCGGKGPFNKITSLTEATPPPALFVVHGKKDNTIDIKKCYEMVKHGRKKSWTNNGTETAATIKELYLENGNHNLIKNPATSEETMDKVFDFFFQYLGRPCSINVGAHSQQAVAAAQLGAIDSAWPGCKSTAGKLATDKCGGIYADAQKLGPSCEYPP